MIKDGNYMTILGWMRTRLGLDLDRAAVYAIIYGFSQDKCSACDLSVSYIADWIGKSEETVRTIVKELVKHGYISKEERPGKTSLYKCEPLKNLDPSKILTPQISIESTPQEFGGEPPKNFDPNIKDNNNKEKVVVVERVSASAPTPTTQTTTTTTSNFIFKDWWDMYGMQDYGSQFEQCIKFWNVLNDDERKQVMDHTKIFAPINLEKPSNSRKQPFYYLCRDKMWKDSLSTLKQEHVEITNLSDADMRYNWRNNIPMVQARNAAGKYLIVTKEVAQKYNLTIIKDWLEID